uniref:EF-hand domain-containing protein n=1 Tax=Ditylenchus dipsaci TaxID=166011 RepID=A0A915EAV4_9BILA
MHFFIQSIVLCVFLVSNVIRNPHSNPHWYVPIQTTGQKVAAAGAPIVSLAIWQIHRSVLSSQTQALALTNKLLPEEAKVKTASKQTSSNSLPQLANMSKAVKKKVKKTRTGSEASQFDQKTIQEFKEAFGIMDQNKDGIIDKNDLKDLYAMMGTVASDSQIDAMLKEAPGPINFTVFLTLFGERLTGTDPEATILGAFEMFDKTSSGFIQKMC